jgi:hypothetical protein
MGRTEALSPTIDVRHSTELPRAQIADFRGDYSEVARLIQESWQENGKQGLFYTPEFLASCLNYPGAAYSLAPTMYQGEKPCAFVAGFPRTLRYHGRELRILLCTLLSVSNEYKKTGYGIVVWNELVKRAQSAGFHGMVNYCVDGESMNAMILGCCKMLKLPTARIFSIPYLMRLLPPKPAPLVSSAVPPVALNDSLPEDLTEKFCQLADLIPTGTPLARVWNDAEARWQLHRHNSVLAHYRSGAREGLLTGYIMPAANAQKTKCLLVEDILWGTLQEFEREPLVKQFLNRATQAGAQMAFLPSLGYADLAPFKAARFRTSPRMLHCYLTVFKGDPAPEPVQSMYLDVV